MRLAVIVCPTVFIYQASGNDSHFSVNHYLNFGWFIWIAVMVVFFFGKQIVADMRLGHKSSPNITYARTIDDGQHFDFLTLGTPAYNAFHLNDKFSGIGPDRRD
jgi:hypothetical protein